MLTIDITINGRTIHKYLVCRGGEVQRHGMEFYYHIYDNDELHLGQVTHAHRDGALVLSNKVLELLISKEASK